MSSESTPPTIEIETTQTLDTMLHQVLNLALVAIDAEAGSLMLVANRRGILQIKARLGKPRAGRKREQVYRIEDNSNSIASWVVNNRKSYLCEDVDKDPHFAQSRSGRNFLSLLSVPVIYRDKETNEDKVIAVINADAPERGFFTHQHRVKLEAVAKQVAAPIAERISILDALAKVGVELSRLPSEGGVEPVLEKIAQLAAQSLGADIVTLYQYDQEDDDFPVEGTGPTIYPGVHDAAPMRRKVYPGDVPWTVVKERKSGFYSYVEDQDFLTRDVERPGEAPRPRFIEREGVKSMAVLLLPFRAAEIKDEEVVGAMFVNYRTRHEFNIDEISALATFADYAAVAILNARHEQQRRAEQIQIAESISANFAHRMGNLAGTSRVAAQILRERIDPDDLIAQRQLDRIERESNVLMNLAARIAQPFKETGSTVELLPIDIDKILDEEIGRMNPDLGTITVEKDVAPGLPRVLSVEFQLRQVLHDIINNAVEAMSGQESGRLFIRGRFDRRSNRVAIDISDTGPGIRDDIRDKLFTPGSSTKPGKLGIGLWWCKSFMQATGGDVSLKDVQSGEGATFALEIPAVKGDITLPIRLPIKDLLIVDDDLEWLEQLKDAIASEDYSIECADSYKAALRALQLYRFKLAVIDVRLQGSETNRDGLKLLSEIDRENLETDVIMTTGYSTSPVAEVANRSPRFRAFIRKRELDVREFRNLVQECVHKSRLQ